MDVTQALRPRKPKRRAKERRRKGAGVRKGVASQGNARGTSTAARRDLTTINGAAAAPKVTTEMQVRRKYPLAWSHL